MPQWVSRVLHYLGLAGDVHFLWTVGISTLLVSLSGVALPSIIGPPLPALIGMLVGIFLLLLAATSLAARSLAPKWFAPKSSAVDERWREMAEIFSQPVITEQHIYLLDFCRWMGRDVIVGKTFVRCLIEGPAALNSGGGMQFINPLFEADQGIDQIFYGASGTTRVNGVIRVTETMFAECRFAGVGFLASDEDMNRLREQYGDWSRAPYHPLFMVGGVPPVVPQPSEEPSTTSGGDSGPSC